MEKWEREITALISSLTIEKGVGRLNMMEVLLANVLGCAEMIKMTTPELLMFVAERIVLFEEKWRKNKQKNTKVIEKRINEMKEINDKLKEVENETK